MGKLLLLKGEYDEAVINLNKALGIEESNYGLDRSQRSDILKNLGEVSKERGDYAEAIDYFKKCLDIKEIQEDKKGRKQNELNYLIVETENLKERNFNGIIEYFKDKA